MRFFILLCLAFSLSAISCKGRRFKHHLRSPDIAIDKLDNRQIKMDNTFIFVRNNQHKRIHLICRGQEGCLHICDHFNHENFDHSTCKQLSVSQVINFWITRISEYKSWEQARNDLTFIATNKDVADFIKVVDKDGRLMKSLFRMGTSAICPIAGNLAVRHSPYPSLYILRPDTEQQETTATDTMKKTTNDKKDNVAEHSSTKNVEQQENKVETTQKDSEVDSKESNNNPTKVATTSSSSTNDHSKEESHKTTTSRKQIINGSITPFNFPIFFSFIKKCFGVDPVRTFTSLAVEIENRSAFEIAHQVLAEACNNNSECIRLAYCNVDSELVWNQVDERYKELGCEYDSFMESIPHTNISFPSK